MRRAILEGVNAPALAHFGAMPAFRGSFDARQMDQLLAYLRSRYALEGAEAAHVVRYIAQQRALSELPDERRAVIEIYRMDNRQTAVFHPESTWRCIDPGHLCRRGRSSA